MSVVVLGASGFIGSAVIEQLIDSNQKVCILARPNSLSRNKYFDRPNVNVLTYTSLEDGILFKDLQKYGPEVMINLSWKGVGQSDRNKAYHFIQNMEHMLQSVKLASKTGCTQWIGTGSQAEYGIHNKAILENSPCNPLSAYGQAKLAAGIKCMGMCNSLNIKGTWARIFSVYGPGDHTHTFINYIITSFLNNQPPVLTACEQRWDYLFITDAASAILSLVDNSCEGIFNLGSGDTMELKKIVEYLKKFMQYNGEVYFGDKKYDPNQIMHLQANVDKIKLHTKWEPIVSITEGLQKTALAVKEIFNA